MTFLLSLIPTIIVLGILITIHEWGHFIACRLTGVKVDKFSIGFGPEILHWQGKETRFVVALFPLGGYVKPSGESVSDVGEEGVKPGDYLAAPLKSRVFIVCAGVLMNYFLAFVIFSMMFMMGRPVPGTTIGGFVEDYPAHASVLEEGDRIVAVDGREVRAWPDLTEAIERTGGAAVELTVERGTEGERSELFPVVISPKVEEVEDVFGERITVSRLGIFPDPAQGELERYGVVEAIGHGAKTTVHLTVMTHKAIFYLVTGRLSMDALAGPVGIIALTGDAAQLGLPYLLQLTAILSVSLAVINLLPIPALDGGHLLFLLIEGVRRKRVSLQFQERMTQAGFMFLLALMLFLIYNDLINLDVFGRMRNMFGTS